MKDKIKIILVASGTERTERSEGSAVRDQRERVERESNKKTIVIPAVNMTVFKQDDSVLINCGISKPWND